MPKSEKIFKEIAAKLDKLEHNPIYHFSLSNKELFHSNFIAWFFQEYVIGEEQYNVRNLKILGNIFPPNIKKKITQDYLILKKVQRECKNIDLTFDFKQHKTPDEQAEIKLYLENKIKSVPNKSQLYSYSLKLAGGKKKQAFSSYECILLSLMRPVFFKQGNDKITFSIYDTEEKKDTLQVKKRNASCSNVTWYWVSYEKLANSLKTFVSESCYKDEYHKKILEDYLEYLQILIQINSALDFESKTDFPWTTNTIASKIAHQYRLNDYIQKKWFAEFAIEIKNTLKNISPELDILCGFGEWKSYQYKLGHDIYVGSDFSNSNGLVDIKYRFPKLLQDPWFIYGIQIQAGKLKLFTEYVNPKNGETERKRKSENIAKELFNQNLWFDILLDKSTILYGDIYPIKNKEKLFNHFSPSFFYRYRNIIPGISVESLLDTIKGFQNYVIKEKEAIAKIIQDKKVS